MRIADVCIINPRKSEFNNIANGIKVSFVPMQDLSENQISFKPKEERRLDYLMQGAYTCFRDGDVLLAKVTPCFENGKAGVALGLTNGIGFGSSEYYVLRPGERALPEIIYYFVTSQRFRNYATPKMTGTGGLQRIPKDVVADFQIPLLPMDVQKEIVAEIEGYQKIIDGARQVVENYQPRIPFHPGWPTERFDSLCDIVRGSSPRPQGDPNYFGGPVPRLMVADITRDGMYVTPKIDSLTEEGAKKSRPMNKGSVVMAVSGNPGLPAILRVDACIHDGFVGFRNLDIDRISAEFLYYVLLGKKEAHSSQSVGAVFKNLTTDQIREFVIPLPNIDTQQAIIFEIEAEQRLVDANKELIHRFEKKIKQTINRVWGDPA